MKIFTILTVMLCLISMNGMTAKSQPSLLEQVSFSPSPALFASQNTKEVVFGTPRKFEHKSGWFSLVVPDNWTITDKSTEEEVIVSIVDPAQNAVLIVRVYRPTRGYMQSELGDMLKAFLNDRMSSFDGFMTGEVKSQRDGSLGLYFKYNSIVDGKSYRMYGDTFIEQHNGLVGLVALIMPEEQYELKRSAAYEMVNSFHVTGAVP
jgi:hypothetical protein